MSSSSNSSRTSDDSIGLYLRPQKKTTTTLRQRAMDTVVKKTATGKITKKTLEKTLPPLLTEQVVKRVKTITKRKNRENKIYRKFTDTIDEYFSPDHIYSATPLWLLTGFNRLVEAENNDEIIEDFQRSRRKFQKVGNFDAGDYVPDEKFSFYFVKHNKQIYLSVYDNENTHIFSMPLES